MVGNNGGFSQAMYGYLDEVRISKGINRYSVGRFTVPTEPYTDDANTRLLIQSDWSEGSLGADHSGNYNAFTYSGLQPCDMVEDNPNNNFATLNSIASVAAGTASVFF